MRLNREAVHSRSSKNFLFGIFVNLLFLQKLVVLFLCRWVWCVDVIAVASAGQGLNSSSHEGAPCPRVFSLKIHEF